MICMFCFISLMVSPPSSPHLVVTLLGILICIYLSLAACCCLCFLCIDEKNALTISDQITRMPMAMMMIIKKSDIDFCGVKHCLSYI